MCTYILAEAYYMKKWKRENEKGKENTYIPAEGNLCCRDYLHLLPFYQLITEHIYIYIYMYIYIEAFRGGLEDNSPPPPLTTLQPNLMSILHFDINSTSCTKNSFHFYKNPDFFFIIYIHFFGAYSFWNKF